MIWQRPMLRYIAPIFLLAVVGYSWFVMIETKPTDDVVKTVSDESTRVGSEWCIPTTFEEENLESDRETDKS